MGVQVNSELLARSNTPIDWGIRSTISLQIQPHFFDFLHKMCYYKNSSVI